MPTLSVFEDGGPEELFSSHVKSRIRAGWGTFTIPVKGDHIERWVGSGLLVAERRFHPVQGYREIPALLTSMANTISKKGVVEAVGVA